MTADEIINKMKELYGNNIYSPDVFPKLFEYQVKMAVHSLRNGL